MRIGRLEESAYKRINKYKKSCQGQLITISKTSVVNYSLAPQDVLTAALNKLYAAYADPIGISVSLILPTDTTTQYATAIMEQLSKIADVEAVPITDINATAQSVDKAIVTVTVIGRPGAEGSHSEGSQSARPQLKGHEIVIAGAVAGLGTTVMAELKSEKLLEVFAEPFVRGAANFREELSVRKIAGIARENGGEFLYAFSEGGIFAGLWDIAGELKSGLSVDLKKIPIRQETIELSEVLEINPYLIDSTGAVAIITGSASELIRSLENEGIKAESVGTLKAGNDKVLLNDGEVRYIDRPQQDEIYRLFE